MTQAPDGFPAPTLYEAVLDSAMLEQLFVDLATHARILSIKEKAGPKQHAPDKEIALEQARDNLKLGRVRAVQIRYIHEQSEWTDTLLDMPEGVRLIRCRHQ